MLNIAFYTAGVPFDGDALETGPLGGSESAFIEITRALAKNHKITAFNNCKSEAIHHGVHYYPFKDSLPILAKESFDILVVSRFFGFFNLPVKASLKVLWNHDTLDNTRALRCVHDEIDLCLCLSRFHRDNYLTRLPQLDDRMVITRNGLNFELLDKSAKGAVKNPFKVIYASRPERGLKLLLEDIWPRIRKNIPEALLYICGYNLDKDQVDPRLLELYDYLELKIKNTPGVFSLGPLSKKDYYRHLAESSLVAYPCVFPEISCLVALEAQALGTSILTTNGFALTESVVRDSMRVTGRPGSSDYNQNFVNRAVKILSNPEASKAEALLAQEHIRAHYSWDQIAREWLRLFELSLRARESRSLIVEEQYGLHAHMVQ